MKSNEPFLEIDIASHVHQRCNMRRDRDVDPIHYAKGDGIYLIDSEGKRYLDAVSGLWCAALGYSEKRLVEAARRQMEVLPFGHTFFNNVNDPSTKLAAKLLQIAPVKMSKVLFQCSGSEANDTAIKLAWYYQNVRGKPRKRKIISRWHSYHGSTIAAASAAGKPDLHRNFNLPLEGFLHTACPYYYGFSFPVESEEDFTTRLALELDNLIERENGETVAAFIADPVIGGYAAVVPPRSYFEKIQKVLRKHDVLFIADEIITGFCRTGNMWGSETFSLEPDIISCAKGLSAAYAPISAVLVNDKIYEGMLAGNDEVGLFGHGFTYGGHPVAAVVALEAINIYEESVLEHVRNVAPYFQGRARELSDHPIVGNVDGVGLMAGIAFVANKSTKEAFDPSLEITLRIEKAARSRGLIIRRAGDRLALAPPLVIQDHQIDELMMGLRSSFDEVMGAL
jgi:4-aminobutyrate--pyruvate transaminase